MREFMREEIEPWDELEALRRKSQQPCENCPNPEKIKVMNEGDLKAPDDWEKPQKILVILAHPDDPEFFCGATLARWARAGHEIHYFLLTGGDKGFNDPQATAGHIRKTRRAEQEAAAAIIGVRTVRFLGLEDGYLVPSIELRREVVRPSAR